MMKGPPLQELPFFLQRISWILFLYSRSDRAVSQQRTVSITASNLPTLVPQKPPPSVSCSKSIAQSKAIIISGKIRASCSKCSWLWVKQQGIIWGSHNAKRVQTISATSIEWFCICYLLLFSLKWINISLDDWQLQLHQPYFHMYLFTNNLGSFQQAFDPFSLTFPYVLFPKGGSSVKELGEFISTCLDLQGA